MVKRVAQTTPPHRFKISLFGPRSYRWFQSHRLYLSSLAEVVDIFGNEYSTRPLHFYVLAWFFIPFPANLMFWRCNFNRAVTTCSTRAFPRYLPRLSPLLDGKASYVSAAANAIRAEAGFRIRARLRHELLYWSMATPRARPATWSNWRVSRRRTHTPDNIRPRPSLNGRQAAESGTAGTRLCRPQTHTDTRPTRTELPESARRTRPSPL